MNRPEPNPAFQTTPEIAKLWPRLGESNTFLTGRAGTGKSTVTRQFHATSQKQVAVVAPTGTAALNAGGVPLLEARDYEPARTLAQRRQKSRWSWWRK